MRPAPFAPEPLRDIDLVLPTPAHAHHLNPGTLGPIAAANLECLFVVPASCAALARSRGVPAGRLVEAHAFALLEVAGVAIHPLPSAHEELAIDDHGRHLALGYVADLGGVTIYHSGDCAPYPGLADNLSAFDVDLGLLPVNGRDAERLAGGIPGNFSLDEALSLAESAPFGAAIGHHFGMFDFNTIDEAAARAALAARSAGPAFVLAEEGLRYAVSASRRQPSAPSARIRP